MKVFLHLVPLLFLLPSCSLEIFLSDLIDGEPGPPEPIPATILRGSVTLLKNPSISVHYGDGSEITVEKRTISSDGAYEIYLPRGEKFTNLRIMAGSGNILLKDIVHLVEPGGDVDAGGMDALSTTVSILLEVRSQAEGFHLGIQPCDSVQKMMEDIEGDILSGNFTTYNFYTHVQRIVDSGSEDSSGAVMFVEPDVDTSYNVNVSPLNPEFLEENDVDYNGDSSWDEDTVLFDASLVETAALYVFEYTYSDELIRTAIAVDMNEGRLDGNCDVIDRFKWAYAYEDSGSMFFVGGIHPDSDIQDPEIDEILGNWSPNTIPMYDDGTHGDDEAGDNIWTITFDLPIGLKIGYKFTWGVQSAAWTGTEEWPGNQRLLEMIDVNGDHIVSRLDNFGDETSNKDRSNLYRKGTGVVDWDTDSNQDGVPDSRERMIDSDNDCLLDTWWAPSKVVPITEGC